jgi:hypothetical protein
MHINLWKENLKAGDHSEDTGMNGRIILKDLREIEWVGVAWILLVQDWD